MSLTRRQILARGLATVAGASGLAVAARLRVGDSLTYGAQRVLTSRQSLAREFPRSAISSVAPVNGPLPETEAYLRLLDDDFDTWRLTIDGLVARPSSWSLADLRSCPMTSQVTMHTCEEGWSFIAEWSGVALSHVLDAVGTRPEARYVVFYPFDQWWDSVDMADALHPQTVLAYAMNGETLPLEHGAPLRLRVARQLGYKSIKYLSRISVVDSLDGIGQGVGSSSAEQGYAWYAGI
jgi:DMSO/TMAO reductase YedYZ molybdopterin-dependent catalytic subunit